MTDVDAQHLDDGRIVIRPLLTARDVSCVLGVGERTVWRLTSRSRAAFGAFPQPIRIGGKIVRWRWQDVEKYLQKLARKQVDVSARQR